MQQNNPNQGDNSALIAVLVLIVIVIAAWIAYNQGLFSRNKNDNQPGVSVQVNLPVTSNSAGGDGGY